MLYALNDVFYGLEKPAKSLFNLNYLAKELAMAKDKKKTKKAGRNYVNGNGPRCGNCGKQGHYRVTCKQS